MRRLSQPHAADAQYVVRYDSRRSRYVVVLDGRIVGLIDYRRAGDALALVHTQVDASIEGHGVGQRLVAGALDDIRAKGLRVIPVCPSMAAYLDRHPEQRDLVAPAH